MRLLGKVLTAKIGAFGDLEVTVLDRDVEKPMGGRPQYTCRVVRGWPGLEDVRAMKKRQKANEVTQEDVFAFAAQAVPLPQEDQVLPLVVFDIAGNKGFKTLLCEYVGQP